MAHGPSMRRARAVPTTSRPTAAQFVLPADLSRPFPSYGSEQISGHQKPHHGRQSPDPSFISFFPFSLHHSSSRPLVKGTATAANWRSGAAAGPLRRCLRSPGWLSAAPSSGPAPAPRSHARRDPGQRPRGGVNSQPGCPVPSRAPTMEMAGGGNGTAGSQVGKTPLYRPDSSILFILGLGFKWFLVSICWNQCSFSFLCPNPDLCFRVRVSVSFPNPMWIGPVLLIFFHFLVHNTR